MSDDESQVTRAGQPPSPAASNNSEDSVTSGIRNTTLSDTSTQEEKGDDTSNRHAEVDRNVVDDKSGNRKIAEMKKFIMRDRADDPNEEEDNFLMTVDFAMRFESSNGDDPISMTVCPCTIISHDGSGEGAKAQSKVFVALEGDDMEKTERIVNCLGGVDFSRLSQELTSTLRSETVEESWWTVYDQMKGMMEDHFGGAFSAVMGKDFTASQKFKIGPEEPSRLSNLYQKDIRGIMILPSKDIRVIPFGAWIGLSADSEQSSQPDKYTPVLHLPSRSSESLNFGLALTSQNGRDPPFVKTPKKLPKSPLPTSSCSVQDIAKTLKTLDADVRRKMANRLIAMDVNSEKRRRNPSKVNREKWRWPIAEGKSYVDFGFTHLLFDDESSDSFTCS